MFALIVNIVGPVFLLLLAGFVAVKIRALNDQAIDGVMRFATHIAVPCLLFRATSTIDLATAYNWRVLVAYFGTAIFCFYLAFVLTRKVFARRPGDAVAVSFGNLFSNLILLGVPIVDRAFGPDGLAFAIAMISINAPVCFLLGISVMEGVRADGRAFTDTATVVFKTLLQNSLMIAIILGFAVNVLGMVVPVLVVDVIEMIKSAALPCALFALGGVLTRYALVKEIKEASLLSMISLFLQPLLAYALCTLIGLDGLSRNVVVVMSATPAGLNAFLIASMYSRGIGSASTTVFLSTAVSILTISAWLWVLVA